MPRLPPVTIATLPSKENLERSTTKNDLMTAAKENYEKLNLLISKMTEQELNTPFDFSKDEKKKEAHWNDIVPLK